MDFNSPRRAVAHGERALKLHNANGADKEDLAPLKAQVAVAQIASNKFDRGAQLYEQVLASDWSKTINPRQRAAMEDELARAYLSSGNLSDAIGIYSIFLNFSGDEAARSENEIEGSTEAFYAKRIEQAADDFAEVLKPTGSPEKFDGGLDQQLATSRKLAELGAFFAIRENGLYAAAGLLSSAYEIRRKLLGEDHQDTVQITLILGPVYTQMGRLDDAEQLYLDAFHAQEKSKGANNPDLSLYIKLLVNIYEQQGRTTEAQALFEHMNGLFRDAFGTQRYAINRARDRRHDIDRPVSQQFVLEPEYAPTDLVRASDYSIPVSKDFTLDEMKLRLAADPDMSDAREANMPARLAQLISLCRSESNERISLRSGYRGYKTQHVLHRRNLARGTVTPPGMSEHQLGLAADIDVNGRLMRRSDRTYQCFEENAYQYGFILSYPPGNNYLPGVDTYEPWHWRYVGVNTAQLYREAGPFNKPQEFLASLPCYRERAISSGGAAIGQADLCFEQKSPEPVATATVEKAAAVEKTDTSVQLPGVTEETAHKLNNPADGAASN